MSEPSEPDTSHAGVGLARNAFYLLIGQVASTALAIVYNGALGRSLGASDFGLYFLISSFAAFASVIVDWGQQAYGVREVARDPGTAGALVGTGIVVRTLGTALICLPTWLAAWALGYDTRTRWFSVAFVAASFPTFLVQLYGIVFRGRDRMGLDSAAQVANKAATLVLALLALKLGTGLGGVVVSLAVGGVVSLGVAARLYRRASTGPLVRSRETARALLAGGTPIAVMAVAIYVQPYIDAVLLSKLVPTVALGWYGAAKNIMGTLYAPAMILASASYPALSRAALSPSAFAGELRVAFRPMLWLAGLAGIGTFLFGDAAIHIVYGHKHFEPAGEILRVFGLGLFLIFVDMMFGNALIALNRAGAFSAVKIASVVVSTCLDVVFIPWFQNHQGNGGVGTVLAFVLSEIVIFSGAIFLMPRGSLSWAIAADGVRALAAAACTAAVFHFAMPGIPWWLGIPVCVIVFSAFSFALGLVRRTDIALARAVVRQRFARAATP